MKLSVLIPCYKLVPNELIHSILSQLKGSNIRFEILVKDDCSDPNWITDAAAIGKLDNVIVSQNEVNLGRALNRNALANEAKGEFLLFIDGDAIIPSSSFIQRYLNASSGNDVIYGGRIYPEEPPKDQYLLRWKYGRERETVGYEQRALEPARHFGANNFLIRKRVMLKYPFNQSIKTYGYEDVAFATELLKNGIKIVHIDNPTLHFPTDSNETYMQKTRESLETLAFLVDSGDAPSSKLLRVAQPMRKIVGFLHIKGLIGVILKHLEKQLVKSSGSIKLLQLYKILYFSQLQIYFTRSLHQ